ncbi:ABC transporter permease [Paenibacillus puldeungensis]|uniref:ABC transporter permease n=1 Tax=Paenibacillus puldeungensis TaxID=696536 RepID=A0ABW3RY33_9BACL
MTAHKLFVRRWTDRMREQFKILRSIVDLTILLYIGIPGLLLGGRAYYGLWSEQLPGWVASLPYLLVPFFLLFFVFVFAGLSLYIEAGDVLFLRQRPLWIRGLMLRGCMVGLVKQALFLGAAFLLLWPVFARHYGFSSTEIGILYAGTFTIKAVLMLASNILAVLTKGWRRIVLSYLSLTLLSTIYVAWALSGIERPWSNAVYFALSIVVAGALGWCRFRIQGRFDAEVREEERQKTKLTALLLASAVDRPKAPHQNAKPWLFRHVRRMLPSRSPEARIAETLVKSFFRGSELKLYIQFTLAGLAAILLPPYPGNTIVYILVLLLLIFWLNSHRRAFFARELMKILPLDKGMEYQCAAPSMLMLLMPAVICFTAGFGIKAFPVWWGLPVAIFGGILVTGILASFYGKVGIALARK